MSFVVGASLSPSIPRDGLNFWFDAQNHPNLGNSDIATDRTANYSNFSINNSGSKVNYNTDGGGSFDFTGLTNVYVKTPVNVLNTNTVTWVIWFRRSGTPVEYTGLFYNRTTGAVAGVHFGGGGSVNAPKLRYTWNNVFYDTETDLITPLDIWTFCAVAVRSTGATMTMISGTGSKSTFSHTGVTNTALAFTSSFLGWDGYQNRLHNGRISQAFFYTRDLSDSEVQSIYDTTISRHYPLGLQTSITTTTTTPPTTTTTTTSTTTILSYKFTGTPGGEDVCGSYDEVNAYSDTPWASLKVMDVIFEDKDLTIPWQLSAFFLYNAQNQFIEIDISNGKVVQEPKAC